MDHNEPTIHPSELHAVREMKMKRMTDRSIAAMYGVSHQTVFRFRRKHGIPVRHLKSEPNRKFEALDIRMGRVGNILDMIPEEKVEELLDICTKKGYTAAEAVAEVLERD